MKRNPWQVFLVLLAFALFLAACSAGQGAVQGFVELPDDTKVRLTALVVAAVAFLFAKLIELVPGLKFLEEFRVPVSLAFAAELINLLQNAVPDAYGAVAVAAVQLFLELVAVVLVFAKLKERGIKPFK
jgi:hypothetical protein